MTQGIITADSQENITVNQGQNEESQSSCWNGCCVTLSNACTAVVDFFKMLFCKIGECFKAVGNFLLTNKVTTTIFATITTVILLCTTLFLSMFPSKTEEKTEDIDNDTTNQTDDDDTDDGQQVLVRSNSESSIQTPKVKKTENKGTVDHMIAKFQAFPPNPGSTHQVDIPVEKGNIQKLQAQINKEQQKGVEKEKAEIQSANAEQMAKAKNLLEKINLAGGPHKANNRVEVPASQKVGNEKSADKQEQQADTTRLNTAMHKNRPKGPGNRRKPARNRQHLQTKVHV